MVSLVASSRRNALERQILNLSHCCPVERTNPVNCPLFGLRRLRLQERRTWLAGLSLEELEYLLCYHASCSAVKKGATARPHKMALTATRA